MVQKTIGGNKMRNQELRNLIRASGIRNWQVAEALSVSENTFYKMLRKQLTEEEKTRILQAVEAVRQQQHQMFFVKTV